MIKVDAHNFDTGSSTIKNRCKHTACAWQFCTVENATENNYLHALRNERVNAAFNTYSSANVPTPENSVIVETFYHYQYIIGGTIV